MSTQDFDSIELEMDRLRAVVAAGVEANAQLEELKTLVLLMKKHNVIPASQKVAEQVHTVAAHISNGAVAFGVTIKERILNGAEAVLSHDGQRRTSRELIAEMGKLGVIVGGVDPVATLSSYLSREKVRFDSDVKAGGWALKRQPKKAKPEDAGTTSGLLFNNGSAGADQHPKPHG